MRRRRLFSLYFRVASVSVFFVLCFSPVDSSVNAPVLVVMANPAAPAPMVPDLVSVPPAPIDRAARMPGAPLFALKLSVMALSATSL